MLHPVFLSSWMFSGRGFLLPLLVHALESCEEYWLVRCLVEPLHFGFVWFFFFFMIRLKLLVGFGFLSEFQRWNSLLILSHLDAGESHGSSPDVDLRCLASVVSASCPLMTVPGRPADLEGGHSSYTYYFKLFCEAEFIFSLPRIDVFLIIVDSCLFGFTLGFNRIWHYSANSSILPHWEVSRVGSCVPLTHVLPPFCFWNTSVCSDTARCSMFIFNFPYPSAFLKEAWLPLRYLDTRIWEWGMVLLPGPPALGHAMYPQSACIPPHVYSHTYNYIYICNL